MLKNLPLLIYFLPMLLCYIIRSIVYFVLQIFVDSNFVILLALFHIDIILIWLFFDRNLADINGDGKMDQHEFSVAIHLVRKRLQGVPLPKTLPASLKAERVTTPSPPPTRPVAQAPNVTPPVAAVCSTPTAATAPTPAAAAVPVPPATTAPSSALPPMNKAPPSVSAVVSPPPTSAIVSPPSCKYEWFVIFIYIQSCFECYDKIDNQWQNKIVVQWFALLFLYYFY